MLRKLCRLVLRLFLLALLLCALGVGAVALLRWQGHLLRADESNPEEWDVFGVDEIGRASCRERV